MPDLANEDVRLAVPIKIAEAQVAPDTEAVRANLLPELCFRVRGLELAGFGVDSRALRCHAVPFRHARRHAHLREPSWPVRGKRNAPACECAILSGENDLAADVASIAGPRERFRR